MKPFFFLFVLLSAFALSAAELSPYEVVWTSPGKDSNGTVPLGNGETALNAWIDEAGTLHFYISRIDSVDENGQLLKVGAVKITVRSKDSAEQVPPLTNFKQTLDVKRGILEASFSGVKYELWVDANRNVIVAEVNTDSESTVTAANEMWRTKPEKRTHLECSDLYNVCPYESADFRNAFKTPQWDYLETVIEPDTLLTAAQTGSNSIGWYHRNKHSKPYQLTAMIQGTDDFPNRQDPLLHRTFGAMIKLNGQEMPKRADDTTLQSTGKHHVFEIAVNTKIPATADEWLNETNSVLENASKTSLSVRKESHIQWWNDFWNRSWIHFSKNQEAENAGRKGDNPIPENKHTLKIGQDQSGASRFIGEITDTAVDNNIYSATVKPAELGSYMRIFDKITPGGSDGFLIDITPKSQLRIIVGSFQGTTEKVFTAGEETKITVIIQSQDEVKVFINGKEAAVNGNVSDNSFAGLSDDFILTRAYALQRYVTACAGRGALAVKYNGSIFTVPQEAGVYTSGSLKTNPDYRKWGPGYWWQNTRLPYFSTFAAGDFDVLQPFLNQYLSQLPLAKYRTKKYFGFDGAYFIECEYFWGDCFLESYGYEPWDKRTGDSRIVRLQKSGYHKYEWVGGLEFCLFMLDYYEYTGDETFLKEKALPFIKEVLAFFDNYYKTENGKLKMEPAQAVETWWDCTAAMPEVAGLYAVCGQVLRLAADSSAAESAMKLIAKLPPIPVMQSKDGKTQLAPAARFADNRNCETPELYAVFPFRLFAYDKEHLDWALEALKHRTHKMPFGWAQDDVFYAYLGQRDDAVNYLLKRAKKKHVASRFPVFWGPNFDWVPDQDHGGILTKGVQALVMQTDGKQIDLFPALPKGWDVDFKLHAPYQTTVEGKLVNGKITELKVLPKEREKDIRVFSVQ